MRLTLLVVSRTPALLSQMLASVPSATKLLYQDVEILCSWNGSAEDEARIENGSGYEFMIAQRDPYHFAANMNLLADKARGDVLLFINDDVVLDAGSIDAALECLSRSSSTGMVGSRLRNEAGQLTHAGILFDSRHSPYHLLDRLIASEHQAISNQQMPMPAVTGALFLIRREHFLALRFQLAYKVCGEDVELCLDVRERLGLKVVYCPSFSGVHASEATRSQTEGQDGNSEDMTRMRMRRKHFLEKASRQQLNDELFIESLQAEVLRSIELERQQQERQRSQSNALTKETAQLLQAIAPKKQLLIEIKHLQEELSSWQEKCHSLQLTRLRLEQKLHQQQSNTPANH